MKHTAQYIEAESTIRQFMSEAELPSGAYLRLYHAAIRGLLELHMDVCGEPVTARLKVSPNRTVQLPSNCLQWVKAGVITGSGEVATIRHNPSLTLYAANDPDRQLPASQIVSEIPNYRNYAEGGIFYNLLGIPGGTTYVGEFRVEEREGIIVLNADFAHDEIVLEYIADPTQESKLLYPVQVQEALISWLRWINAISRPAGRRSNATLIQIYKREYYNNKRLARRRLSPLRLWDANDVIRLNNRYSIKS